MLMYSMWEKQVHFVDGWFVWTDTRRGQNSVISPGSAKRMQCGYEEYQASQDINRGGVPPEAAYSNRGIVRKDKENGAVPEEKAGIV